MIIKNNEEALRVICQPVAEHEVASLLDILDRELKLSALEGYPGIGLAAPQIGIDKNIAIVRSKTNIDLINPVITSSKYPFMFTNEGCLSFPGRLETTSRFQEIDFISNNRSFSLKGLDAVVVQHEVDHLNSILFPDRILKKLKPNEKCFCGSNKKYKKCHGA